MNIIKTLTFSLVVLFGIILYPLSASAQVNVFTEHQIIHMTNSTIADSKTATGKYPYIGRVGVEYERGRFTYGISYIHRSNADLQNNEYYYDGISLSVKLTHCLLSCNR